MREEGRYTICAEIASGSTATVFLAEDRILRRKVALKKLHPHLINHVETVKRFEKEAVAVAKISHENIIRVYDYGNQGRNLYLAMEYVDGCTLEAILAGASGPLPMRVCQSLFLQLLRGLAAAHGLGIVHRDIKPSNLLVDRGGRVRVADFGIAFLVEEKNITKTGAFMGTPVYCSPEQALCRPTSAKSDVFSAGILLYRSLTGKLPFDGESPHAILEAILSRNPLSPSLVNPRVLPGFSDLALRMMSKDPEGRPTAAECLAELESMADRLRLPIESEQFGLYLAGKDEYADEERRVLSLHFLELARIADAAGKKREAVKLATLAEIHGALPAEADGDLRRLLAGGGPSRSRRPAAVAALGLALAGMVILAARNWPEVSVAIETSEPAISLPAASRPSPGPAGQATSGDSARPALEVPPAALAVPPAAAGEAAQPGLSPRASSGRRPAAGSPAASRPQAVPAQEVAAAMPARSGSSVEIKIVPTPGFLVVKTNPPFARVSLGDRELGTTPFKTPVELPVGSHALRVEREGCLPADTEILIEAGRTTILRLALPRAEAAAR